MLKCDFFLSSLVVASLLWYSWNAYWRCPLLFMHPSPCLVLNCANPLTFFPSYRSSWRRHSYSWLRLVKTLSSWYVLMFRGQMRLYCFFLLLRLWFHLVKGEPWACQWAPFTLVEALTRHLCFWVVVETFMSFYEISFPHLFWWVSLSPLLPHFNYITHECNECYQRGLLGCPSGLNNAGHI